NTNDLSFTPDTDAKVSIEYDKNCRFTISFDNTSSEKERYASVNNLFRETPDASGIPCFTARIISTGEFGPPGGSVKRVMEAYLVRTDYSPYNIGTEGALVVSYSKRTAIYGKDVNAPGYITSNWNGNNIDSIAFQSPMEVISNNGIFSSRGKINIDGNSFDGVKMEDLAQKSTLGKLDVDKIIDRAQKGDFKTLTVGGGRVTLEETLPDVDLSNAPADPNIIYYSGLSLKSQATGFDSSVNLVDDSKLELKGDIYVDGGSPQDSDKNLTYNEIEGNSNVFQIKVSQGAIAREGYIVVENTDVTTGIVTKELEKVSSQPRDLTLNLNNHNIYSNSHLLLGIDIEGEGSIVSRGKVAYSQGLCTLDTKEVIISGDDLTIESSGRSSGIYGKGFFYASDDLDIRPMDNKSVLNMDGQDSEDGDLAKYRVEKKFTVEGVKNKLVVGQYDPGSKSYEGHAMMMKTKSKVGEVDSIIAEGRSDGKSAKLQMCIVEDEGGAKKNLDFGEYKVSMKTKKSSKGAPAYKVELVDENDNIVPLKLSKLEGKITEEQLNNTGTLMAETFKNDISSIDIYIDATIVSLNNNAVEGSSDPDANMENQSRIQAGSCDPDKKTDSSGSIKLGWYPDYMKSIVPLQGTNFKVRLGSCREKI
ncbi:MAG: hypothetical protein ABRQ37_25300, partial [Candidatus Eremiobacterota bacterium]